MTESNAFAGKSSVIFKFTGVTAPALPRLHAAIASVNERYEATFFTANGVPIQKEYFPKDMVKIEDESVEIVRILSSRMRNKPEDTDDSPNVEATGTYVIEIQVLYFLTRKGFLNVQFVGKNREKYLTPLSVIQEIFDAIGIFPEHGEPLRIVLSDRGGEPPYVK